MTFSPPKDVSALWATSSTLPARADRGRAPQGRGEHAGANRARGRARAPQDRRGRALREGQSGCSPPSSCTPPAVWRKTRKPTAIPDPQLHSHVAVIAAERKDGKIAAVESRQLYRAARENGAWYRAELAANLQELGLQHRTARRATASATSGSRASPRSCPSAGPNAARTSQRAAQRLPPALRPRAGTGRARRHSPSPRGAKTSALPRIDVNAAWRALGEEHDQSQTALRGAVPRPQHRQPAQRRPRRRAAQRGHPRAVDDHRARTAAPRRTS